VERNYYFMAREKRVQNFLSFKGMISIWNIR